MQRSTSKAAEKKTAKTYAGHLIELNLDWILYNFQVKSRFSSSLKQQNKKENDKRSNKRIVFSFHKHYFKGWVGAVVSRVGNKEVGRKHKICCCYCYNTCILFQGILIRETTLTLTPLHPKAGQFPKSVGIRSYDI